MSIPRESSSSAVIRRGVKYHVAALKADPAAAHLEPATSSLGNALKAAAEAVENAETALAEARALHTRADLELDSALRNAELAIMEAVSKNRSAPQYRAILPSGLSALVAGSGEAQARVVRNAVEALREHLPEVAARYAESLLNLSQAAVTTERAKQAAEDAESAARVAEVLARSRVREQLYRNRGALGTIYPGDARRVRSFFQSARSASSSDPDEVVPAGAAVA
jgi:hypothetical protein